jgi:hypothetical protein
VSVRYHVVVGKRDERVAGPDDAEIVITVPIDVVRQPDFDPTVEFMRGKLKAAGHTGRLLELLKSGEATGTLAALAADA